VNLLPTPTTTQRGTDANRDTRPDAGPNLHNAIALLPTPRAGDGEKGGPNQRGSSGDLMLPSAVHRLLPTPEASRAGGTPERHLERKLEADGSVRTAVTNLDILAAGASTQWGNYAPAIARWEHVLDRPAPAPTMTSTKGNPQLSPAFVEWMQGLPAGWVTDVPGITRNEALKALGNGVVPQQAAAALRLMLGGAAVPAAAGGALLPTPTAKPENADDLDKRAARVERARAKHGRPFGDTLPSAISKLGGTA
jgi:DNA (cytosine-5)-methyltransferase 1